MSENRRIRWAILGTSWISEVMAKAMMESVSSELVAIGSRDGNKAKYVADKFSIPTFYDNYEALLNDAEIDAVYIGLPNHLHKEWIIRCAKAGKHILCEKPFVLNAQEAEEALAVVKESNVFCMEALMYRCHPFISQLQKLIENNAIGELKFITATYTANIAMVANPTAGGAIRNLGCYPVSLIRLLFNDEPIEIIGQGKMNANQISDTTAMALLKFNNDRMATVSTSDSVEMWWQFDMLGTKGTLSVKTNPWLPDKNNQLVIKRDDKEECINVTAEKSLYTYQIDSVNDHIISRTLLPRHEAVTWEHSKGNVAVLDTWLKQIKQRNQI